MKSLSQPDWEHRIKRHLNRISPITIPHSERQQLGIKHPIYDFLFSYYSFTIGNLTRWQPGFGVSLTGDDANKFLNDPLYCETPNGVTLDPSKFPKHRIHPLEWIINLLENVSNRQAKFGCFGLHEWAMVYKAKDLRYNYLPLRLKKDDLDTFVESQNICCTHYDAFRFFTPDAKPLNSLQPIKILQPAHEQRGCVHVNMDLYKWAYKFYPWIGSDLIADSFLLAVEARELDMRASPYDFVDFGFSPIRIETPEGRMEYVNLQKEIAEKAIPIRNALLNQYRSIAEFTK